MDKGEILKPTAAGGLHGMTRDALVEMLEEQLESGIRISFTGKANARSLARRVRPRVARPLAKYGAGDGADRARNLVVEGDNLQAMATLYRYRNQVDLILADPPYNTGKDFRYNDRWEEDPNDPGLGDLVGEDDTARHTKWMRFMWPRLQMMKAMLKPSGVLAVCIDQRELFRLGQMLDELFREQNRVAIINWQRSYTRTNDAANVATTTEYLLVYARDLDKVKTGLLPRKDADGNGKAMPDNDPRPWVDGPATGSNAKAHKSMVYAIQSPFTGKLFYPPMGSAWRAGQEQNLKWLQGWGCKYVLRDIDDLAKRATSIGVAPSAVPSVKAIVLGESIESASKKARALKERGHWPMFFFLKDGFGRPRLKKFVEHLKPGYVPTTFWASDDFSLPKELGSVSLPHHLSGHSEQGVDELTAVVGSGHEFKTVKPLKLFQQVVDLWSPKDGLILDPFAGTGTTAHAALALNATQGAARRFIMIEQGRPERGDSYARTLTSKRLQRAVSGKWANRKGNPLGGGFEFVTLEKTVDAGALLKLERDEMVDTIIGSHFESDDRRGPALVRISKGSAKYLVANNTNNEGVFLIWNGPGGNTNLTREVYGDCVKEAKAAGLEPVYHVYARLFVYQTHNVVFYQIPDRILADFGLDLKSEPFADTND